MRQESLMHRAGKKRLPGRVNSSDKAPRLKEATTHPGEISRRLPRGCWH
jgi:hypothetical protein